MVDVSIRVEALGIARDDPDFALACDLLRSDATFKESGLFGGLWVRQLSFTKKGDVHQGHSHNRDHVTIIAAGAVLCEIAGEQTTIYHAPATIQIPAAVWHKFTAAEDATVYYCVFSIPFDGQEPYLHTVGKPTTEAELRAQIARLKPCGNCGGCP